jgi:hypothetical protein
MKKKIARVKFNEESYRTYDYMTYFYNLTVGDKLVVNANGKADIVYFVEYVEEKEGMEYKWIISNFDLDEMLRKHEDKLPYCKFTGYCSYNI